MWEPQHLTTPWASTACYRDTFNFIFRWELWTGSTWCWLQTVLSVKNTSPSSRFSRQIAHKPYYVYPCPIVRLLAHNAHNHDHGKKVYKETLHRLKPWFVCFLFYSYVIVTHCCLLLRWKEETVSRSTRIANFINQRMNGISLEGKDTWSFVPFAVYTYAHALELVLQRNTLMASEEVP
jgi:hypothetical protein